jgi:hypothetical protein
MSILSESKYAPALSEPAKSRLIEEVLRYFGGDFEPVLLGSGIEGEAWRIEEHKVLKIHTTKGKFIDLDNKVIDTRFNRVRMPVYDWGAIDKRLEWAVMPYYQAFEEYELSLEILLIETLHYVEKLNEEWPLKCDIRDTSYGALSTLREFGSSAYVRLCKDSDINARLVANEMRIKYPKLSYGWVADFVRTVSHMHLTNRSDDLYLPNLGIGLGPDSYGALVFFDW